MNPKFYIFAKEFKSKFILGIFQMQKYKINMVKLAKKQKIFIEDEKIPILMDKCDCSRASVYYALSYVTNSKLAKQIRETAISELGAKVARVPFIKE